MDTPNGTLGDGEVTLRAIRVQAQAVAQRLATLERDFDPEIFSRLAETRLPSERLQLLDEVERYEEWKTLNRAYEQLRKLHLDMQRRRQIANRHKMAVLGYFRSSGEEHVGQVSL